MKRKTLYLSLGGIVVITLLILIYWHFSAKLPLDIWCNFTIPEKSEIGYSPEGLINDLPLPNVREIKGQYKFLNRSDQYLLGYKIYLNVEHLDTTKLQDKYRHDEEIEINGKTITALRTTEVTYKATLDFNFIDKDGFELLKMVSDTVFIESGKNNELQGLVERPIPKEIIKLTNIIKLHVSIEQCVTCLK